MFGLFDLCATRKGLKNPRLMATLASYVQTRILHMDELIPPKINRESNFAGLMPGRASFRPKIIQNGKVASLIARTYGAATVSQRTFIFGRFHMVRTCGYRYRWQSTGKSSGTDGPGQNKTPVSTYNVVFTLLTLKMPFSLPLIRFYETFGTVRRYFKIIIPRNFRVEILTVSCIPIRIRKKFKYSIRKLQRSAKC